MNDSYLKRICKDAKNLIVSNNALLKSFIELNLHNKNFPINKKNKIISI